MRAWLPCCSLVALAVVTVAQTAAADAPAISLRWTAPAGCPDGESVRLRVLALTAPGAQVDADVTIDGPPGDLRAAVRVKVGTSVGERSLSSASCQELAESVALVLALAATSEHLEPPPPPPLPPPPPPAPPHSLPPNPAPAPALDPSPSSPSHPHVRLSPQASVDVGTLPSATVGATLAATVPFGPLALGLAGTAWLNQSGTASAAPSQGAHFALVSADLSGCYALPLHLPVALSLSPCAVVELLHISATGQDTGANATTSALWVDLGAGGLARWELSRAFALSLTVDALVPTQRQAFTIQTGASTTSVHTTSRVAGQLAFGPEVRF